MISFLVPFRTLILWYFVTRIVFAFEFSFFITLLTRGQMVVTLFAWRSPGSSTGTSIPSPVIKHLSRLVQPAVCDAPHGGAGRVRTYMSSG